MKISKLFIPVLILLFIMACGVAPTEPPAPTETPAPTSTATKRPTATRIPATATPQIQQFFTEDFQGPSADQWVYFLRRGNPDQFFLSVEDDGLLFELNDEGIFSYAYYDAFTYEEVKVETTIENQGVNDNNVTLFCMYSEDKGWYEFNIYSSGLYDMYFTKPDSAGNLNYGLIAEGGSNKIKQGLAENTYAVVCDRDSLTLFINGTETRSVGLPPYVLDEGKVGVSVSSFGQVPVKVLVKQVVISEP
jgi:hypothetical protein